MNPRPSQREGFTLIELLVVIAIIAILTVVVILTLNPAELLRQARDSNRVADMTTISNALNVYITDQGSANSFSLGTASNTYLSIPDPNGSSTCGNLGLSSFNTSSGQAWQCASATSSRLVNGQGWIPVNLSAISSGAPIGSLPVDPTNQTSSGYFYSYNTNGSQFEVTANLESTKNKAQYGTNPQTSNFPEVISGGIPTISALYNPSGLVGYWNFDEGSGSSTIDRSGNGNNGTWHGAATGVGGTYYGSGKVGSYAGVFDGSTTYENTGIMALPTGNSPRSVFMWVNIPGGLQGAPESYGTIDTTFGNASILIVSSNALALYQAFSSGGEQVSSLLLTPNTWQFIGYTYTGGTSSTVYVGTQSQTLALPSALNTVAGFSTIGGIGGAVLSFKGLVDDVRIYNRALSAAEIQAIYTAEK